MAIPDYQTIMLPLLKLLGDGHVHPLSALADQIAQQFSLTLDDRNRLLPSGVSRTFDSRVGWAATYMSKAGLIERPHRSHLQVTSPRSEAETMTTRRFQVMIQWDPESRVWVTYVPVLDYLSTFGQTREEALAHTREAILGYIEAAQKEGLPVPDEEAEAALVDVEVAIA